MTSQALFARWVRGLARALRQEAEQRGWGEDPHIALTVDRDDVLGCSLAALRGVRGGDLLWKVSHSSHSLASISFASHSLPSLSSLSSHS